MSLILTGNSSTLTVDSTNGITFPNSTTQAVAAQTGPAFYAYASVSQTLTAGVAAKLRLNTENYDTNNNFDPTTNYRFTPTVAGYYQLSGSTIVGFSGNNGYLAYLAIYKNGSEYSRGNVYYTAASAILTAIGSTVSSIIYCNGSTDYIEFWVRGDAGSGTISTDVGGVGYNFGCGCLVRVA